MIVFGGSEGGKTVPELQAAYLASHGYTTLALAYFGDTGVPAELSLIPLEYFATAIDWLTHQPSVNPHHIGVRGGSRGGELALLLGSRFPQLKTVVASAPSNVVWGGLPNIGQSAWSENGRPVPFLIPKVDGTKPPFEWWVDALDTPQAAVAAIPVERINGPVLLLNGADDQLWPSPEMTDRIMARLRVHRHPYPDRHLQFVGTGQKFLTLPNGPTAELPAGGKPADWRGRPGSPGGRPFASSRTRSPRRSRLSEWSRDPAPVEPDMLQLVVDQVADHPVCIVSALDQDPQRQSAKSQAHRRRTRPWW